MKNAYTQNMHCDINIILFLEEGILNWKYKPLSWEGDLKIWKIYSLFFGRGNFKLKLCTLFWGKKISNWTYIPLFGGISNFEICTLFFGRGNSKLEICTPFRVREIMYPFGVRKISNWKYIPFYRGREFQIVKSYTLF